MITNADDIRTIYETGEGKLKLRAKTVIEDSDYGRKNIVITEIPYTVAGNKQKLLESLLTLTKDKVFDEIYDVRDESSKEGIRLVVEVKKDRNVENLLNGLYKKTALEDTYGVNFLAVKDKQPFTFTLKGVIDEFVHFQEELYTKEYEHLLAKAKDRQEIVTGLIVATDVIDLIIEILRGSNSVKQAKLCLTLGITDGISFRNPDSEYEAQTMTFTERQADAILAMPLSRLVGLELMKLHQENETLLANIAEYEDILGSITKLHKVIKKRLTTYKKQFGRPRRTELCNLTVTNYIEEVKEEDIYVLIDRFGYAKSMDSAAYGRLAPETLQEIPHTVMMKNTDKLCVFTDQGNMYQIKAKDIPKGKARDKGILIHNLCKMNNEENGLLMISFEELFNSQLLFITKKGYVKQVSGIEFETSRYMVNASKLDADDLLVAVEQVMPEDAIFGDRKVIMITKKGMSLGFPLAEVNEFKKTSRGLKGITLTDNDEVLHGALVQPDTDIKVFDGKKYNVKRIKLRKRNDKPMKSQILVK